LAWYPFKKIIKVCIVKLNWDGKFRRASDTSNLKRIRLGFSAFYPLRISYKYIFCKFNRNCDDAKTNTEELISDSKKNSVVNTENCVSSCSNKGSNETTFSNTPIFCSNFGRKAFIILCVISNWYATDMALENILYENYWKLFCTKVC